MPLLAVGGDRASAEEERRRHNVELQAVFARLGQPAAVTWRLHEAEHFALAQKGRSCRLKRVLVVEDDAALRLSLATTLKAAAYVAIEAGGVAEARRAFVHHCLLLVDLGLPDGERLDLIAGLRAASDLPPVVVLSARDCEAMKVAALDVGADAYVTKPLGVDQLLASMRAALRHAVQTAGAEPLVRTGALEIDLAARVVRKRGREIGLSPKEYETSPRSRRRSAKS